MLFTALLIVTLPKEARAIRPDSLLLERMYGYASAVPCDTACDRPVYNYTRFALDIERKNITLLAVPTMFAVANGGQRHYIDESYNLLSDYGTDNVRQKTLLRTTTTPHRSKAMENIFRYLTPKVYQETIIDNYIISPFIRHNSRFYDYTVTLRLDGTAIVKFMPRRSNTQLVDGQATVDFATGRIIECSINGEYDMINFSLSMVMGNNGRLSLLPVESRLATSFRFLGNRISGRYVSYYDLTAVPPDSIRGNEEETMASLRPDTLTTDEKQTIEQFVNNKKGDSATAERKNRIWDIIGKHTINRIKSYFGDDDRGYVRINPILNPLYFGYSHRRGVTYKFDIRASYMFSPRNELSARLKAGYSFKQKQLHLNIPVTWYFDKRRNGYISTELGNGNRIANSMIRQHLEEMFPDSVYDWKGNNINDFRNNYLKMYANVDLSPCLSLKGGVSLHQRKAVDVEAFRKMGQTTTYHSSAPLLEVQLRPWKWKGPILTVDYERSIKGMLNSDTQYERWEMNGEYTWHKSRLQTLHLRVGGGFYTLKDRNAYFCDYENFRENTLQGGWNDDWSGEFEMLRSDTYNQSDYYVRANASYESPLLLFSRIPYIGKYMEMERVHVSCLDVKGIHPYMETGYGFTTRLFSFGLFASFRQWKYDAFGVKWGFELFRKW